MQKGRQVPTNTKKKLFIIADAAVDTGFASVSHNIINALHERWDIDVLAVNYYGDPHPIQKIANLWSPTGVMQGDVYGFNRVKNLLHNINPDVVLVINDPWIGAEYVKPFAGTPGIKVLYTPVDAGNIKQMFAQELNKGFDHVVAYTQFGANELIKAGLTTPTSVIPHGIDTETFYPLNKNDVRKEAGLDPDWFIVQMVNRNQIRKRIDLGLYYFSQWVHMTGKDNNVKFYYHGALVDEGWDIAQLAYEFGINDRLILSHKNLNPAHGFPLQAMKLVYNVADIHVSSTLGEGWGFTTMESMACGIANIVPRYSALGEWANGGVLYADIDEIPFFNTKGLNTRGGVPEMRSFIRNLELLYKDHELRNSIAKSGYELVTQPKYQWKNIVKLFEQVFNNTEKIDRTEETE